MAGLLTGAVTWRRGLAIRVRWGAFAMACTMLPLYFVESVPVMGLVLLLGGFAIAPTLIGALSLTERTVPSARPTEGMAIMHTGLVAGVAPGATIGGVVIDAYGASLAYLVCVAAGVVAAIAAQALPRSNRLPAVTAKRNWSGLETARPSRVEQPADVAVVAAVERARAERTTVKMAGTGHSFTAIAAPEAVLLTPQRLSGIVAVDRDAMTVTALAGTPLKVLNAGLEGSAEPAQHGRHRRADPRRRDLHRHPRDGWRLRPACRPRSRGWSWSSGTGEVLRATSRENPTSSTWPGSGWGRSGS